MNLRHSLVLASLAFAGLCSAHAQNAGPKIDFPAASPTAVIKQRAGLTDFEITYARPSAKGRAIFGGLVPYGEVWRTGANFATKISFNTPVKFEGKEIAAGTYELFTIPGRDEWTVILHKDKGEWGAYAYDAKDDVARVTVKPVALSQAVETFTIGFDALRDESATLTIAWDKTLVPVKLGFDVVGPVVQQIEAAMASDSPQKPYFPAAIFYLDHNLDLNKALSWVDTAIQANPDAFYFYYHKARILAKLGNKTEAIATARKSIEVAGKMGGAVKDEYVRLNEALIASLK
ncbi:MAG: DUF2911 domain-containing protein [Opitutus sp.]|mgnify:CR=1 FL=1|nr:DUF2911 domain-containing protein [Opitutus sp.]